MEKPFPQEQELNDKLKRLAELNSLLDMDEKGEDAVDLDEDAPKLEPEKEVETQQTEDVKLESEVQGQEQGGKAAEYDTDIAEPGTITNERDSDSDISEYGKVADVDKPDIKPAEKAERPSLIARLNEKKDIVASMDRKAPNPQKKREEVIA